MCATYSRIVMTIPIVICASLGEPWSAWPAAILFMLGSLTDWLDGYLARKFQAESPMGKFMDPIADKILVLGALVMLLEMQRIDAIMVLLLLSRDIYIGGVRAVAATSNVIIAAKPFGKWKTALQMICIPMLFVHKPELFFQLPIDKIGLIGLWLSVGLSILSGIQYTYGFYRGGK